MDVNMTSQNGAILETAGKYCTENIKVVPTFDFIGNAKRWEVTILNDSSDTNVALVVDPWLAQHRSDEGLNICIYPKESLEKPADSKGAWCLSIARNKNLFDWNAVDGRVKGNGIYVRKNNNSDYAALGYVQEPLTYIGTSYGGQIAIMTDGRLLLTRTENYPLRAGDYAVIAWID